MCINKLKDTRTQNEQVASLHPLVMVSTAHIAAERGSGIWTLLVQPFWQVSPVWPTDTHRDMDHVGTATFRTACNAGAVGYQKFSTDMYLLCKTFGLKVY